jgi:integrase
MPRKPKIEKQIITVVVSGRPVSVILHPPTGTRTSWYVYWNGLMSSRSTGQRNLEDAIIAAENMIKRGGQRANLQDAVLSDEEFAQIQRVHFERITDDKARARAQKTLASCLDAIYAFREITGLSPVALASPDDCSRFQRVALTLPKKWRLTPSDQRLGAKAYTEEERLRRRQQGQPHVLDDRPTYSPNNILKWSRTLQAAFERANRNATKRKCVRGVVDEHKLLAGNPWAQFPWIEGRNRPIRQFDPAELVAFLDHFETEWRELGVVSALAKVCLWSSGRRLEIASLTWGSLRIVGPEHHFHITGKWGVEKWFRVPEGLYRDLEALRSESDFVFAAYGPQLRDFYLRTAQPGKARKVLTEFDPENLANWFYKKIKAWSKTLPKGHATTHIFRKTSLQYARTGEDINRQIAHDARVSESVLMTNYVRETDVEMRRRSNRTYERILASLTPEVACRYGHIEADLTTLEQQLVAAMAAKDWRRAAELTARLATDRCSEAV